MLWHLTDEHSGKTRSSIGHLVHEVTYSEIPSNEVTSYTKEVNVAGRVALSCFQPS